MRKLIRTAVLFGACLPLSAWAASDFSVVAVLNHEISPGVVYKNLIGYPCTDASGNLTFIAGVGAAGDPFDDTSSVISGQPSALNIVAQAQGPTPIGGVYEGTFAINSKQQGPASFGGNYDDPAQHHAQWEILPGGVQSIAVGGDSAPNFPAGTKLFPQEPAINPAGQIAYSSYAQSSGGDIVGYAIFSNPGTFPHMVAETGQHAVGYQPSVVWDTTIGPPVVGSDGNPIFVATLHDTLNHTFSPGIFSTDGITTTPLALAGQSVGGANIGPLSSGEVRINHNNDIVFHDDNNLIWLKNSSGVHRIAGAGDAMPGGSTLNYLSATPDLTDDDRVVFKAVLNDFREGLFYADTSGLHRIVATGDFIGGGQVDNIGVPMINQSGQIAYQLGIGTTFLGYLFGGDLSDASQLLFGPNTIVDTPDGPVPMTATLYPFDDVPLTELNDSGQVVFIANDSLSGTNAIIEMTVPEPASAILAIAGSCAIFSGRRRRQTFPC